MNIFLLLEGVEPSTLGLEVPRAIQLRYRSDASKKKYWNLLCAL